LRISKHCENFHDLGGTVPALIKINSSTPFDVRSNIVMPQALKYAEEEGIYLMLFTVEKQHGFPQEWRE